jgi:hypothetical protein
MKLLLSLTLLASLGAPAVMAQSPPLKSPNSSELPNAYQTDPTAAPPSRGSSSGSGGADAGASGTNSSMSNEPIVPDTSDVTGTDPRRTNKGNDSIGGH